ncbi:hypothetical protein ASPWEDRAFT_109054 [Aspergillus wentii DTO 134E9]|uniref:FAD/NAD(P)-binding domain-containing protein n=1 Tax=Aspergillus wentii DTO 134E9 TaxID=1073089 RepID=A0A1L9RN00_ASPWE|nr:uncharacterized protein ASPWEDRAFT_109054 [Aspergillus wentii DTO 134E9]OJJ36329.1 hypothetical protein ASPWEDRAFT_109054 [Aspergillus wentii DTO 134E9]
MAQLNFDALVVGAGFGGIYACKKLVDQNLSVKVIDTAGDVGGTWYWNRYPGALSDTYSVVYRFSWDLEDLRKYPWKRNYVRQPEVLAYLQHVVERHDLRRHMQFNTKMTAADWDEDSQMWTIHTTQGTWTARYLITAMGLLNTRNYPNIPGLDSFKGDLLHTSAWPEPYSLEGKRVGVIGNGSTGVQIISAVADHVDRLVSFQRTPQYVVPSGEREISAEERQAINDRYEKVWKEMKDTTWCLGARETTIPTMSVDAEERERIFEEGWQHGGGFDFMFGTFGDIAVDEQANHEAAEFIKRKIRAIVKDPVKAEKLIPNQLYARRPLCTTNYYEKFNRENVDIVNTTETPITAITETGIETTDGAYDLDVIVCATGFDGVEGTYNVLPITGRKETLKKHWEKRATAYLGISVVDFPNFFMVTGPYSPFANIPPILEEQINFISTLISRATGLKIGDGLSPVVEVKPSAEEEWTDMCEEMSSKTLFDKTSSWLTGDNIAGKRHGIPFYLGGVKGYRKILADVVDDGYKGYKPLGQTTCNCNKEL